MCNCGFDGDDGIECSDTADFPVWHRPDAGREWIWASEGEALDVIAGDCGGGGFIRPVNVCEPNLHGTGGGEFCEKYEGFIVYACPEAAYGLA